MKATPCIPAAPLFALLLLLGGCARVNDMAANVLASDVPAHAVVGEHLLAGRALLYADRSGRLTLDAGGEAALSCMGTLRFTATSGGMVNLRCSDGTQGQFPFTALSELSGHGSGRTTQGAVSLAYGLDPEPARAWLSPPAGKRLVLSGAGLRLE